MMRPMKRGLGFAGGAMTAGGAVPMPDRGGGGYAEEMPYEGGGSADELAPEEIDPQSKGTYGDGWTDLQRSFRDEVEGDEGGPHLYAETDAWLAKWRQRARDMGLSDEEAMAVLDSIADLNDGYWHEGPEGD